MNEHSLPPGAKPFLTLTAQETDKLSRTGKVRIDDPERGQIEVTMFFDENHPGLENKRISIRVIRSGTAAQYDP